MPSNIPRISLEQWCALQAVVDHDGFAQAAEQRWTVSHLKTSIQVLKRGLGFAWVPREHIREELSEGLLKPLPLVEGATAHQDFYLIFADRDSAGPATRELAAVLRQICGTLHLR